MRRWLPWAAVWAVVVGGLCVLGVLYEHHLAHALGIDTQQSQEYDFVSGVGPMIITALGLGSLITGLLHHVNCHQAGCWRIGKHKVAGTPWCGRHHQDARPTQTVEDLLRDLSAKMDTLITAVEEKRRRR